MSTVTLTVLPDASKLHWALTTQLVTLESDVKNALPDTTSRLLSLPRELRDLIYEYVLHCSRPPPPSPPFAGPRVVNTERERNGILYSTTLPRSSVFTLLHSCQTIRREALDLMRSNAGKRNQEAELDIMARGFQLHPTWTRLPPLIDPNQPIDVTVHIRVFSPEGFRGNDGWPRQPGLVFRNLLSLLNQFLHCGPGFSKEQAGLQISISKLTVRLSNLDIYTPRMFPTAVCETVRMCKSLSLRGDLRRYLRTVRVSVQSKDMAIPGHEGKDWQFEVSDVPDEEMRNLWDEAGFHFEPEAVNFATA